MATRWMTVMAVLLSVASVVSLDPGSDAAAALALRVLGPRASSLFSFGTLKDGACASTGPCAVIASNPTPDAVVLISGSTPVEMAYGLAHYCRTALNMSFSWNSTGGNVVRLPPAIPRPTKPIKLQKHCAPSQGGKCYTYYTNVCTLTYSMWSWSWARWQQEIDWMALAGVNLVLAYTGREAVYRRVYASLGLNQSGIGLAHGGVEAGPAFLAFSRTESWTGHDNEAPQDGRLGGPLPDSFVADQLALNRLIVARQTELGIGSILPAFQGNVPDALRRLYPTANISKDGWLDGLDPLFSHISDLVLSELIRDFGRTGFYEADGFFDHTQAPWLKGGRRAQSAAAPLAAQLARRDGGARAAAVYASMKRADANAVWVYQGWVLRAMSTTDVGRQFIRSFVGAVPPTRLVLLDMEAESEEVWRKTESWYSASFVWAAMDDFGGTNGLFGDVHNLLTRTAATARGAVSFAGVGITMEGIDQNPPYYALALDSVWVPPSAPRNATASLIEWGVGRCGKALPDVERAWSLLARSVYRRGQQFTLHHIYCSEATPGGPHSCDAPSCEHQWDSPDLWRGTNPNVSRAALEPHFHDVYEAWVLLARSADECDTEAARFDAVDVGREFLQIAPCALQYSCAVRAFKQGSATNLTAAGDALLQTIRDIDALLSSQSGFVLGSRLAAARALGHTDAERDLMEWNQRSQVTLWVPYGPADQPPFIRPNLSHAHGIAGYATKQWGGLERSIHLPRYKLFLDRAAADLASPSRELNISRYLDEVGAMGVRWENERWDPAALPDWPVGNPVAISKALQKRYAALGTGWAECPAPPPP